MKKTLLFVALLALTLSAFCPYRAFGNEIETQAKSVILIEAGTGRVLYESNPDEPLPPASVTKIMTLLLAMEALDGGKISLEDRITVSERAAKMGGSQIYLEPGEEMSVDEMIKCVAVASANDAAAALAEYISGSLESFVKQMNRRAAQLGMSHTHFENVNGLDDTVTTHLTSAADVAIMSRELIKHEKIFDYTTVWMDSIRGGAFGLTNTNRLVRFYKGCNGLKTGSTSKAGFCISATALRDGMQLIAVVMGSPTRDERNATAAKLLDYGFANYEVSRVKPELPQSLPVSGGKSVSVRIVCPEKSFVLEKGQGQKVEVKVELPERIPAPVEKGQSVGRAVWLLDGKELGVCDVTSADTVEHMSLWDVFLSFLNAYTVF